LPITTRYTLIILSSLLIATDPVFAQQLQLEEITVTARKREESLQEIPLSVTAISAEQIDRLGIRNLEDITRYTPGVNLDIGFGLNDQRLVIRGLSPSRGRPNSAILVDGIDLTTESVSTSGGSMLFNSRLVDVERVEVVKGPQSALYGRAAFTGAISYVSKDPGDELETEAGIDIGEYGRRYIKGAIGGPISDTFGLRLNALSWNEDGFYNEGLTGANLGGGDGYGLSVVGKWEPADSFSARARVSYSDDNYDQQATFYDAFNTSSDPLPEASVLLNINPNAEFNVYDIVRVFTGTPADAGSRTAYLSPDPVTGEAYPGGTQDALNTSLTLSWDVGAGTISSYTGYVKGNGRMILDGDFDVRLDDPINPTSDIARGGSQIDFETDTRLLSQEIRYTSSFDGPVQFTVGALYWDEAVDQHEIGVSVIGRFPNSQAPVNFYNDAIPATDIIPNDISRDTNSTSVYGMIEWSFADAWKLTAEARYAREEMDVTGTGCDTSFAANGFLSFYCPFATPDLAAEKLPGNPYEFTHLVQTLAVDSSSDTYIAPRVSLEWTPMENLLTYISVSQGVKPGGIATVASGNFMDRNGNGTLEELKFDSETLTAYELGAKSTLFDRRVILNGTVFFQDYQDKQIPVQNLVGNAPFTTIENAGNAEVLGLELETTWLVTEDVRLHVGYSYLDAEYTEVSYDTNSTYSILRAGNCIPGSPIEVVPPTDPPTFVPTLCTINLNGNTMEDVPEHSLVALAGYYPTLGSTGLSGLLEADVEWQDKRFMDEFNDRELDSFSVVNLRLGVQTDKWDAMLYLNNALDNDTIKSWSGGTGVVETAERDYDRLADPPEAREVGFPAEGFSIAPPPRQLGFRANVRF
jgi:iron complex outermembrane receptor protein